jgi:hypothetical protein
MTPQFDLFGGAGDAQETVPTLPEGFRYPPELIGPADEGALLARMSALPFREFEFHGYTLGHLPQLARRLSASLFDGR